MKFNIIVVGCKGKIENPWRKYEKYIKNILAFDPNGNIRIKNKNINIIYSDFAISNYDGKIDFYLCEKKTVSSTYCPNKFFFQNKYGEFPHRFTVETILSMPCSRLDSFLNKKNYDIEFDFLIIDTQGSDLDVIKGMGNYLNNIYGIFCELFYEEVYKGIYLFDDARFFLENNDFFMAKKLNHKFPEADNFLFLNRRLLSHKKMQFIKNMYEI